MHCSLHRSLELFEDLDDDIDAPLLLLTALLTVWLCFYSVRLLLLLQQREDVHCLTDHVRLISNRRAKNICPPASIFPLAQLEEATRESEDVISTERPFIFRCVLGRRVTLVLSLCFVHKTIVYQPKRMREGNVY